MTSDLVSGAGATPVVADDLTRIRGIGPAIARHLQSAGITTFGDLAAHSPAELAALVGVTGLSAGHVARKDWVGQALALAAERAPLELAAEAAEHPPDGESLALAPRQHYATFMLELLLDEENHVRRTRVAHIQGAAEESWAGWRAEQLLAFFGQQAQLQDAPAEPPHPAPPVEEICPGAALHIRALELAPEGEDGTRSFVGHGQPFELRLSLALDAAAAVKPWQYDATVYAKSLDSHSRGTIGQAQGTLPETGLALVRLAGAGLARGIYRLEATVSVRPASAADMLTAFWEGGLIQVY